MRMNFGSQKKVAHSITYPALSYCIFLFSSIWICFSTERLCDWGSEKGLRKCFGSHQLVKHEVHYLHWSLQSYKPHHSHIGPLEFMFCEFPWIVWKLFSILQSTGLVSLWHSLVKCFFGDSYWCGLSKFMRTLRQELFAVPNVGKC